MAAGGVVVRLGRSVLAPFINLGSWYNATAKASPVLTGVITSGLKTSAADLFAQKVIERREEVDWTRHSVYCLFGFAYLGGFQYYLYNVKFVQWCSSITAAVGHKGASFAKTFLDQCVHHPLAYFPTFFTLKAMVEGKPLSYAVEKYQTELWDSLKALWSIWVPAQIVNFAFVPKHLRIPYVAGVSFLWTVVLSCMQGQFDSAAAAKTDASLGDVLQNMQPEVVVRPAPISIESPNQGFAAAGLVTKAAGGGKGTPENV